MGFIDSLKSMVGSGSPTVEVKLFKNKASMQESVKGIATFIGGEYPVTIEKIILYILTVEELKDQNKTKESDEKVGIVSLNDYVLEPKEVITVPFQLKIPKDNLITSSAIKHYVKVLLDISGQDVWGVQEITVV